LDREVKRVPVRTKVWEVKEFHVGKIPKGRADKNRFVEFDFY